MATYDLTEFEPIPKVNWGFGGIAPNRHLFDIAGFGIVIPVDATPPTISTPSPAPGELPGTANEARLTPVTFSVEDLDPGLLAVLITCQYEGQDEVFVVHDGSNFVHPFDSDNSTRTATANGYDFTVLPRSGWLYDFELFVYAIDAAGNLEGSLP